MAIPIFDPHAQNSPLRDDIIRAVTEVIDSGRYIGGPEVDALESEIKELIGVEHAVAVSSGTDALLAALMAVDIGPGDEVITSAFSFFASAGSIIRLGATPVFVDIEPETFNMDPSQAFKYVGEGFTGGRTRTEAVGTHTKVKAILPVHLFGQCVRMGPIEKLADEYSLMVVEDACQSLLSTFKDKGAGTFGDAGCFSFYPTKNLGGMGDGGLVVTDDPGTAEVLVALRNHGQTGPYHHDHIGGNFRLDAIQAAILRVKLKHCRESIEQRQESAALYAALFEEHKLFEKVFLPRTGRDRFHTYNQFVIRIDDRDELRAHLESKGIGTMVYYPLPLHLQPCFKRLGYEEGDFPNAERACKEVLALPIYPGITREQQTEVVEAIAAFCKDR